MDESVRRALARWPDVPDCYGWLRLDARGNWCVRAEGGFSRIANRGLIEFINRNYMGEEARYFFQNGPQRVYVECEYTPFVYRLGDDLQRLMTHTDLPCSGMIRLLVDEQGALLVDAASGPGVLLDRDLPAVLAQLRSVSGAPVEPEDLLSNRVSTVSLWGALVPLASVRRADAPGALHFDPRPIPP